MGPFAQYKIRIRIKNLILSGQEAVQINENKLGILAQVDISFDC